MNHVKIILCMSVVIQKGSQKWFFFQQQQKNTDEV